MDLAVLPRYGARKATIGENPPAGVARTHVLGGRLALAQILQPFEDDGADGACANQRH